MLIQAHGTDMEAMDQDTEDTVMVFTTVDTMVVMDTHMLDMDTDTTLERDLLMPNQKQKLLPNQKQMPPLTQAHGMDMEEDTEDIPVYNVGEELITEPTDMDTHTPDMDTDTTSARDLLMLNQKPTPAQTHGTVMEVTDMAVDTDMVTHIGMVVTTDVVTTDTANKQHQKFQKPTLP